MSQADEGKLADLAKSLPEFVLDPGAIAGLGANLLGTGGFSKVYIVTDTRTGDKCVAKELIDNPRKHNWRELFCTEVRALARAQGRGVLKLRGFTTTHPPLIITDFCEVGPLSRRILDPEKQAKVDIPDDVPDVFGDSEEEEPFEPLDHSQKLKIIQEVARALEGIHDRGVIHLDLNYNNVFLDSEMSPVIADFGNAVAVEDAATRATGLKAVGTPAWMAPELFNGESPTVKADIFAFGVLMWAMIHEQRPWNNKTPGFVANAVTSGVRPEWQTESPLRWKEIAEKCWTHDPEERPSAHELCELLGSCE